jgi:Flp pilus assembly protein TadG
MPTPFRIRRSFTRAQGGNAAIEFALVGPLFLLLLVGLVVYGGWFWMAAEVQHLSAEGARAAVAGLSDEERMRLARATVAEDSKSGGILPASEIQVGVTSEGGVVAVTVTYSAHNHPLMAFSGLIPAPPMTIRRVATITTGEV